MNYLYWVIGACWLVFICYWGYSALGTKRTLMRSYSSAGILVRLVLLGVILVLSKFGMRLTFLSTTSLGLGWELVGAVLAVLGISVAVWARYNLGRNWGMPMSIKENPELITTGPYHWVRNPIYTGVIFALLGSGLVAGSWWFLIAIAGSAYFILSLFQEERQMLKEFPDSYPAYKARTWRLLPYIW
jgi:protein-S-isoprenylcysteine O-methyltransferase Ste14